MTHLTAQHTDQLSHLALNHPLPVVAQWALSFALLVTVWDRRVRTRRALARLDAARLQDIGISPEDARAEVLKKFWHV